jgi:hypothetical protein
MGAIQLGRLAYALPRMDATHIPVDDIDHSTFAQDEGQSLGLDRRAQAALTIVSTFVPGEALAFYITTSALLASHAAVTDLAVALATLSIVAVLVVTSHLDIPRYRRSRRRLCVALALALAGAAIYLAAMPNSASHNWSMYSPRVSAAVVLAASILMPAIGHALGFRPDSP